MTEVSKTIINNHLVRKRRGDKTNFRRYLIEELTKRGYTAKLDRSNDIFKSTNVVVGNPKTAKIVISAHYDTPASMWLIPNLVMPKNKALYIIYQTIISFVIIAIALLFAYILKAIFSFNIIQMLFIFMASLIALLYLLLFGFDNPKTYNDNTSGVITLVETLLKLDDIKKNEICAVFFDNEEIGLLGSRYFLKKYKTVMEDKILLNFDCVSDGDNFLFVYNEKGNTLEIDKLVSSFVVSEPKSLESISRKLALYPSDHKGFKNGIGVCSLKKFKHLYYIDRIHTIKDTVFDPVNIEILSNGIVKYL